MSEEEKEYEAKRNLSDNLRRLKLFRPIDDTFMRAMFKDNLELGEFVLRIIMRKPDLKLVRFNTQMDLKRVTGARSICLDVAATDSKGVKYDIEVQRDENGAEPYRARYHSSVLDIENLRAGQDFDELPITYVIFITETDVFEKDEPFYLIQRINVTTGKSFDDGTYILYVNGKYRGNDEIGMLMHDFECSNPNEMHYEIMADNARYLKENSKGVTTMCKIMDDLRIESEKRGRAVGRAEGRAVGRAEGRAVGRAEGRAEGEMNAFSLIKKLFAMGRSEDAERASNDREYCAKLYKEFGMA